MSPGRAAASASLLMLLMVSTVACDAPPPPGSGASHATAGTIVDVASIRIAPEVHGARVAGGFIGALIARERRSHAALTRRALTLGAGDGAALGVSGQPLLSFVHITDVEIGFPEAEARFEVVLEALRGLEPEPAFIVVTGDLTHSFRRSQIATFLDGVDTLTPPVYLIPGNHDLGFHPEPYDIAKYVRYFDALMPYKVDVGPLSLIAFDSQLMNIRHVDQRYVPCCARAEPPCGSSRREEVRRMCRQAYHGPPHQVWQPEPSPDPEEASRIVQTCDGVGAEEAACLATPDPFLVALSSYQWSALRQMMRDARFGGQRLLLAHHIPPVANVLLRRVKRQWRGDALGRFRALLRRYQVEAQLVGHFHKDEVRFIEGVPVLSAPPVSPKFDRQSGFRVYRVWPDGLSYTQHYVGVGRETLSYRRDLRRLSEEEQLGRVRGWEGAVGREAHWRRYAAPVGFNARWEELRPELYWETMEWEAEGAVEPPP